MIFFQGGPGGESPRLAKPSGWCGEVLKTHRLLLLDQRGTGLSGQVMPQTLATRGDAVAQVEYLTHFRADSIVRDAEGIRKALIGDEKWIVMGQSYGGFCLLSYLSFHPEGLSGVIITGGVPVEFSEETARHVGNFRIWVTNEWEHNGIGVDGSRILSRLLSQLNKRAPFGYRG